MEKVKDKDAEEAQRKEDDLEEGLEESMPASDPPSEVQPTGPSDGSDKKNTR